MDKHKHEFIGGMCVCGEDGEFQPFEQIERRVEYLNDSEINDEEVTKYKKFGVG